ncbi:hypothetical protein BH11PSE13_BH11PSE13_12570 [soil metagenome]
MKRGLTHAEAIEYVGIKRRTFDEEWRPHLVAMRQGSCIIFDKQDLDRLFDELKAAAAAPAANDAGVTHNAGWNGRPNQDRGERRWAKKLGGSTPEKMEVGKSISGGEELDFDKVASEVLKRRKAG